MSLTLPLNQEPLPGPSELDRAIGTVFARPEFAERELPSALRWLADLYTAAREALWRMIAELDLLREAAPVVGWLIVGSAVLFLVVILAYLGSRAVRAWKARSRGQLSGDSTGAARSRGALEPTTWETRATEQVAEGQLRLAALALYRAVLLRLDERDVLSYDASKTPGDYLRESAGDAAAADAEAGDALRLFLRHFEPIAFGGRAVSPARYATLEAAAREAGARV